MTDHSRFERMWYRFDNAHRHHNGVGVVDLVFGIMDRWALRRPTSRALHSLAFEMGIPIALVLAGILLASIGTIHSFNVVHGDDAVAAGMQAGVDASPDDELTGARPRVVPYAFYVP